MTRKLFQILLLTLTLYVYIIRVEAVKGLAEKGTKDEPLPKDNPLDYARSKGAVAGSTETKTASTSVTKNNSAKTKPLPGKMKPAPVKRAPAPAVPSKTKGAKPGPVPFDESAYITNINSIGEEDSSGKKKNKVSATAVVPIVSPTVAPSMGKSWMYKSAMG